MKHETLLIAAIALGLPLAAIAGPQSTSVTYNATQGPWSLAINPTLDYGAHDNLAPASLSSGFDFSVGNVFTIAYVSGTTTNGFGPGHYDANGQTNDATNAGRGVSGNFFPSAYVPASNYPIYLSQVIGAFADASGRVVGTPFVIGDLPVTETVGGSGVTQLLFGNNDDVFSDDTGSITLEVTGPAISTGGTIPEPGTVWMMVIGTAATAWALRRPRQARAHVGLA